MSLIVTSVRLCARTSGASDVTRDNGEEEATDGLVSVAHGMVSEAASAYELPTVADTDQAIAPVVADQDRAVRHLQHVGRPAGGRPVAPRPPGALPPPGRKPSTSGS